MQDLNFKQQDGSKRPKENQQQMQFQRGRAQKSGPIKSKIRFKCPDCNVGYTFSAAAAAKKHKCTAKGVITQASSQASSVNTSIKSTKPLQPQITSLFQLKKQSQAPAQSSSEVSVVKNDDIVSTPQASCQASSTSDASQMAIVKVNHPQPSTQQSSNQQQKFDQLKHGIGGVEDLKGYLDFCYLGGKSRPNECNATKSPPGICNCSVHQQPGWLNIFVDPPDPILVPPSQAFDAYVGVRTYFWCPELFYNQIIKHIFCPNCGDVKGKVNRKGWSQVPRYVFTSEGHYLIYSKVYKCNSCNCEFRGHDQQVIDKLPKIIGQRFPALVFSKSAVDKNLALMLQRQVVSGQSFRDFRNMLEEQYNQQFLLTKETYLYFCLQTYGNKLSFKLNDKNMLKVFGDFDDSFGWNGKLPSSEFLQNVVETINSQQYQFNKNYIASLTGNVLSGDHTFSTASVPRSNGRKIFEAFYSLLNEKGQVIGYWLTNTVSLRELDEEFSAVHQRYLQLCGCDGPELFYCDLCCSQRSILEGFFPSLKVSNLSSLSNKLKFNGEIIVVNNSETCNLFFEMLSERARNHAERFCGFDMEWEVSYGGNIQSLTDPSYGDKVAIIQVCYFDLVGIFQLRLFHDGIPQTLVEFLRNDEWIKVGVGIQTDASKLERDFKVKLQNFVALDVLYKNQQDRSDVQLSIGKSLAGLCQLVLKKSLSKDVQIRISKWASVTLSDSQIQYAALDAYCGFIIYQKLIKGTQDIEMLTGTTGDNLEEELLDDEQALHQRVLLDAFHLMNRYPVSKRHVLFPRFMSMLRDSIFVNSSEDILHANQVLQNNFGPESQTSASYHLSKQRIRRFIPGPAVLVNRVDAVIKAFQLIDSTFINERVMQAHKSVLEHLESGCLSDHPDVNLYIDLNEDESDQLYAQIKSFRGSSLQENFHLLLDCSIKAKNLGVLRYNSLVNNIIFRHNVKRAVIYKDVEYLGCFRLDLFYSINELLRKNPDLFDGYKLYNLPEIPHTSEQFGCEKYIKQNLQLIEQDLVEINETEYGQDNLTFELDESQLQTSIRAQDVLECWKINQAQLQVWTLPQTFLTSEELALFLELHNDQIVSRGRVNIEILVEEWNWLIRECYSRDSLSICGKYTLKSVYIVHKFLMEVHIYINQRELVAPFKQQLDLLHQQLRSSDFSAQLDVPALTVNVVESTTLEVTQEQFEVATETLQNDLKIQVEAESEEESEHILIPCPACNGRWKYEIGVKKYNYLDNHLKSYCGHFEREFNDEEKKISKNFMQRKRRKV